MAEKSLNELTDEMKELLQQERLVLLSTIDHESNRPTSSAISWVQCPANNRVRFAIDAKSRLITNIKATDGITLTFFGQETVYSVTGKAAIIAEKLEGVPFPLACVELSVDAVRDAMFYGAKIVSEPQYDKTYNKAAAEKLDNQVMNAMEKA